MQKIEFGSTGLVIEKNGFGCLPIQRISETEAVKLLHKACDGGINFFDTARAYSDSEQKVGAAFSGMRDRIVLATKTGAQTADADIQAVDALIADLTKRSGLTVIAHVPAFSEPLYAFEHQSDSLALYSGALWMDEQRCYWLNPNSTAVQGLLSSIAIELSGLGFDEVVFDDFYVPASDAIAWNAAVSKEDAILNAAKNIVDNLEGVGIHVSFGSTSPALAAYGYHLFDRTDDPADVMDVMDAMQDAMEDIPAQLVFVTTSRDTRFGQCSVLLPLIGES